MRLLTTLSLLALAAPAFAQTASTLDKVKASGAITLAYRESSIPFSYLDDKAQPVGFAHEICLKIVDDVKKAASGLLEPEIRQEVLGHADVRQVFKVTKEIGRAHV